jgi:hypothetical protein
MAYRYSPSFSEPQTQSSLNFDGPVNYGDHDLQTSDSLVAFGLSYPTAANRFIFAGAFLVGAGQNTSA